MASSGDKTPMTFSNLDRCTGFQRADAACNVRAPGYRLAGNNPEPALSFRANEKAAESANSAAQPLIVLRRTIKVSLRD
jgi:hypothetical protein